MTIASASTVTHVGIDRRVLASSKMSPMQGCPVGAPARRVLLLHADGGHRRHIYDHFTSGQWTNSLTGAVVRYTQTTTEDVVLTIPGDLSSGTETFTGETMFHDGTVAPVLWGNGRQLTNATAA